MSNRLYRLKSKPLEIEKNRRQIWNQQLNSSLNSICPNHFETFEFLVDMPKYHKLVDVGFYTQTIVAG